MLKDNQQHPLYNIEENGQYYVCLMAGFFTLIDRCLECIHIYK